MNIITVFVIIVFTKLILNLNNYYLTVKYSNKYAEYFYAVASNKEIPLKTQELQQPIREILLKAGIPDPKISRTRPTGYGQVVTSTGISVFNNMFVDDLDIVTSVTGALTTAKGVYKKRITDSINPIFWIETLVYLPKSIFQYLGVPAENLVTKIFQLLWWICGAFYTIYESQVINLIQSFLSNFFK